MCLMKLTMTFEDMPDGKVKVECLPQLAPIMRKMRDKAKAANLGIDLDSGLSPAESMAGQCALVILGASNTTNKQKIIV
jgi:hypothetical protein